MESGYRFFDVTFSYIDSMNLYFESGGNFCTREHQFWKIGKLVDGKNCKVLRRSTIMKINIGSILILLSLSFLTCSDSKSRIANELLTSNNDTLSQEISFSEEQLTLKKEWVKSLGLRSLENGSSDFEMKTWEDIEFPFGRVVLIKHTNGEWNGEMFKYRYLSARSLSGEKLTLPQPKSGWIRFLNELLDLEVLTLPDYKSLPNYEVPSDEIFVTVEIAKKTIIDLMNIPIPISIKI